MATTTYLPAYKGSLPEAMYLCTYLPKVGMLPSFWDWVRVVLHPPSLTNQFPWHLLPFRYQPPWHLPSRCRQVPLEPGSHYLLTYLPTFNGIQPLGLLLPSTPSLLPTFPNSALFPSPTCSSVFTFLTLSLSHLFRPSQPLSHHQPWDLTPLWLPLLNATDF